MTHSNYKYEAEKYLLYFPKNVSYEYFSFYPILVL